MKKWMYFSLIDSNISCWLLPVLLDTSICLLPVLLFVFLRVLAVLFQSRLSRDWTARQSFWLRLSKQWTLKPLLFESNPLEFQPPWYHLLSWFWCVTLYIPAVITSIHLTLLKSFHPPSDINKYIYKPFFVKTISKKKERHCSMSPFLSVGLLWGYAENKPKKSIIIQVYDTSNIHHLKKKSTFYTKTLEIVSNSTILLTREEET